MTRRPLRLPETASRLALALALLGGPLALRAARARADVAPQGAPTAAAASLPAVPVAGNGEPRDPRSRQLAAAPAGWRGVDEDAVRPLLASVYSLPSSLVPVAEAAALLAAVHAADPARELLVVADRALGEPLTARLATPRLRWIDSGARGYSPWPRDPFFFGRGPAGEVLLVVRPNLQPGRESDAELALELLRGLPGELDSAWGGTRWLRGGTPFHNGQVLLTPREAWTSLHALEERSLDLLGLAAVPVESFGSAAGIARYAAAAERARQELAALYGRDVRLVHPPPTAGSEAERVARMRRLGGGAGFDLDSLVTLVPGDGATTALVGDLAAGARLLAAAADADLAAVGEGYGLGGGAATRAALAAAQAGPAAAGLGDFLDMVAEHLAAEGLAVRRLPLLLAPVPGAEGSGGVARQWFVLGWNNVVVERREGVARAEGFASLWPAGDALARETYAAAGVRLDLFPPLVESVVRGGGYRCASNHLRRGRRES